MIESAFPFIRAPLELLAIVVVGAVALLLIIGGRRAAAREPDKQKAIDEATGGAIAAGFLVFVAMLVAAVNAEPKFDEPLLERCIANLDYYRRAPSEVASNAQSCLDNAKASQDAKNAPEPGDYDPR